MNCNHYISSALYNILKFHFSIIKSLQYKIYDIYIYISRFKKIKIIFVFQTYVHINVLNVTRLSNINTISPSTDDFIAGRNRSSVLNAWKGFLILDPTPSILIIGFPTANPPTCQTKPSSRKPWKTWLIEYGKFIRC